ncbi:MAG: hypothetical protein IPJ75_09705 [Ignavibacteriales bacterium]|nr:hypothetical protein [Ignavibacteriales bacterium]
MKSISSRNCKNIIEIIKYIKKYFKSIDGLGDEEIKKKYILVYQSLSERDNEIRQNIKSMDSRLSSIIRHIKNAGIYESY